jgi:hypothetical protein
MFLGYMSVKDQEPDVQYLLNPEVQPTLQRIEWGLRQLIDDFDSAIGDLDIGQLAARPMTVL